MNVQFWSIAVAMLLLAVGIVVLPLLRNRTATDADGSLRNLPFAKQALQDLQRQLQDGQLSQAQFDAQYLELQQNLNDDLDLPGTVRRQNDGGRWLMPVLALLLPALALSLYGMLSDPDALEKAEIQQQNERHAADVRAMIPKLIERLKQNPGDVQGWLMLGRSYKYLQQYTEAVRIFAKIAEFQPDNVEVLLNYAEALAMAHDGQLTPEAAALALHAVQLAPNDKDALWMAGLARAAVGDAKQAVTYWQNLARQLPEGSESRRQVEGMIAEVGAQAEKSAAAGGVTIRVTADIAPELKAKVQPQQTLFVYAQAANGPKMPLAIVRKQAADLPLSVELNDGMAMQPGMHLADFPALKIVARISKTGNAFTQTGDLLGVTELSQPAGDQPVSVIINQEVQ